jgi:hypothetical protein
VSSPTRSPPRTRPRKPRRHDSYHDTPRNRQTSTYCSYELGHSCQANRFSCRP